MRMNEIPITALRVVAHFMEEVEDWLSGLDPDEPDEKADRASDEPRIESGPEDRSVELLLAACEAYLAVAGRHEEDGLVFWARSNLPKPGDFVVIDLSRDLTAGPRSRRLGWLEEVRGDPHLMSYLIRPLKGGSCWWSNVRVRAIPMGDLIEGDLLGSVDDVFQPLDNPAQGGA